MTPRWRQARERERLRAFALTVFLTSNMQVNACVLFAHEGAGGGRVPVDRAKSGTGCRRRNQVSPQPITFRRMRGRAVFDWTPSFVR